MADSKEPSRAEQLAAQALDPKKEDDVAKAISQLTPEEAAHFVDLLERAIKRRRIQLIGYITALVVLLVGMFFALAYYGSSEEGEFVGWVFFLPFIAVGLIFYLFGRWANRT
jgi:uncharacterized membrane protein